MTVQDAVCAVSVMESSMQVSLAARCVSFAAQAVSTLYFCASPVNQINQSKHVYTCGMCCFITHQKSKIESEALGR